MKRIATTKTTTTVADPLPPLALLGDGAQEDYESGVPEVYVPSGIPALDDLILGAVAAEVTLVAGAPGQGKTALAMQWVERAAAGGIPSAVLSLEMGRRALRNRLISTMAGVDMRILRTREWKNPKQKQAAMAAAEYLASIPLYVDDRSGLDADRVYASIMAWKERGIGLGVIDYLQLMAGANESRVTQVGDAIRAIKSGAKDADIPIILLSALNRNANTREDKRPRVSDLRDSGDIEFVGDTILMFHYPEDDLMADIRVCDIHVVKQRNGPTGIASTVFNKPATKFQPR